MGIQPIKYTVSCSYCYKYLKNDDEKGSIAHITDPDDLIDMEIFKDWYMEDGRLVLCPDCKKNYPVISQRPTRKLSRD